jgi:hypothetical protein
VTVETLPDSGLPEELRALGYDPVPAGETERILPVAIVEHVEVTAGSSITRAVAHAGICRVERWTFDLG